MLAYFDQSARFCVHKQTHKQTNKHLDRPITLPLVRASRARGNNSQSAVKLPKFKVYILKAENQSGLSHQKVCGIA